MLAEIMEDKLASKQGLNGLEARMDHRFSQREAKIDHAISQCESKLTIRMGTMRALPAFSPQYNVQNAPRFVVL